MDSPSLKKRPLFDHPGAVFVLTTATITLLAGFLTFKFVAAPKVDACDSAIGKLRIEMSQANPPSVFDETAWDGLTVMYNQVFASCPTEKAAAFTTAEFDTWSAPALKAWDTKPAAPAESDPLDAPAESAPQDAPTTTVAP
jgi:hypothetical protein